MEMRSAPVHTRLIFLIEEFLELDRYVMRREEGYGNLLACYEDAIDRLQANSNLIAAHLVEGHFPDDIEQAFIRYLNKNL